jgi:cephalosporin hydroxylase
LWLRDVLSCAGLVDTPVYSYDIAPPDLQANGVEFAAMDCADSATYPRDLLEAMDHPALVIEDAHVNVAEVLLAFDEYLIAGDYLYVEDTVLKASDMRAFAARAGLRYAIDAEYVDFFGRNATCAIDGIMVRL